MPNYTCDNCGATFSCIPMTTNEVPLCTKCGGVHRHCFFDRERVCPIPRRMMSGDYCCACTNIQIVEGQKAMLALSQQSISLQEKAMRAEIPNLDKAPQKASNKDVGGE